MESIDEIKDQHQRDYNIKESHIPGIEIKFQPSLSGAAKINNGLHISKWKRY
jgi:hypothetical protein